MVYGANDVGFADIGTGDVDCFFKDFQEVFAVVVFFFVALGIVVKNFVINFDSFKVVFDDFAASILAGGLVAEVWF